MSATTTLVFIPGSVWIVLSGSHPLHRVSVGRKFRFRRQRALVCSFRFWPQGPEDWLLSLAVFISVDGIWPVRSVSTIASNKTKMHDDRATVRKTLHANRAMFCPLSSILETRFQISSKAQSIISQQSDNQHSVLQYPGRKSPCPYPSRVPCLF